MKEVLPLCVKITIVFILAGMFACDEGLQKEEVVYTQEQVKYEEVKNVELLYSDSAKLQVRVLGPKMRRFIDHSKPYEEFSEGIELYFMNGERTGGGKLTAKYAIRYEKENKVIVRDSVVWKSGRGEELRTDELIWNDKEKKVHTKRFVKIKKKDEIFYGLGFEADQDFEHWKIIKPTGNMIVEGLEDAL